MKKFLIKILKSTLTHYFLVLGFSFLFSRLLMPTWLTSCISLISTVYLYLILAISVPLTALNCVVSIISPENGCGHFLRNSFYFLILYTVAVLAIMAAMSLLGYLSPSKEMASCTFSFHLNPDNMVLLVSVVLSVLIGYTIKFQVKDWSPLSGGNESSVEKRFHAFERRHPKSFSKLHILPLFLWRHSLIEIQCAIKDAIDELGHFTKWCSRFFPLVIFSLSYSFLKSHEDLKLMAKEFFEYLLLAWIAQIILFFFMVAVLCLLRKTIRGQFWRPVLNAFITTSSIPSISEILEMNRDRSFLPTAILLSKVGSFVEICAGVIFLGMRIGLHFSIPSVLLLALFLLVHLIPFTAIPMGGAILLKTMLKIYGIDSESNDAKAVIAINLLTDMTGSAINALQSAVVNEVASRSRDGEGNILS